MGIQGFDFFKKANLDIDASSACGGFYTLIAVTIGIILFVAELRLYVNDQIVPKLKIDNVNNQELLTHIDIVMVKSPCIILSLDIQDQVGTHVLDVSDGLEQIRLTKDNVEIPTPFGYGIADYRGSERQIRDLIDSINNGEKCRIVGDMKLKQVPGNFHISYHARGDLLNSLARMSPDAFYQLNVDYELQYLIFGEQEDLAYLNVQNYQKLYGNNMSKAMLAAMIKQATGHQEIVMVKDGQHDYDNFIKIIPVQYENKQQNSINKSEYSITTGFTKQNLNEITAIYFNYELSPVNLIYGSQKKSFYNYLVQNCAIIGGVFSVVGLINSMTLGIVQKFKS